MEAQRAWTPWLLGISALAVVLARVVSIDRVRFKAGVFFLSMHLLALLLTATLESYGASTADAFRTACWVFGSVGLVAAAATLLFSVVLPRARLKVPLIMQDVMIAVAAVVTAMGVASRAGANLSGLIATSAVFTAVIGLSLQDVIGNVAGGLALQVDNSVAEGDWVKVGDLVGRVVELRWRHTAIETRDWETVLVPNAMLMKGHVVVLGRRQHQPRQLRRAVKFNVDWRFQPNDVIAVVTTAVRGARLANVAATPLPNTVLLDMADSFGRYAVRYWLTDLMADETTDTSVRTCVLSALARAGMAPAVPAQALFVTTESAERKAERAAKQLARARRLIDALPFFEALSPEERDAVARGMHYAPFARGEVMTRQGARAQTLYLMESGSAAVRVTDGAGEREVSRLEGPTVFGEMSLLTGEPRLATVVAETDCECFRLEKPMFEEVLSARPELAERFATLLTERRSALQATRVTAEGEEGEASSRDSRALLSRIRRFFEL